MQIESIERVLILHFRTRVTPSLDALYPFLPDTVLGAENEAELFNRTHKNSRAQQRFNDMKQFVGSGNGLS